MTPEALSAIRQAVCAIGWIGTTVDELYTDAKRGQFDIEGTGFLAGPRSVVTCAHVMESLQRLKLKRGPKPFASGAQFVYPSSSGGEMSTVFRAFKVAHVDARIDIRDGDRLHGVARGGAPRGRPRR